MWVGDPQWLDILLTLLQKPQLENGRLAAHAAVLLYDLLGAHGALCRDRALSNAHHQTLRCLLPGLLEAANEKAKVCCDAYFDGVPLIVQYATSTTPHQLN
jgi:hypothetical protein